MIFSTYSLKSISDRFFSFLEKLSQPNSKYITDKISFEITHRRNNALLILEMMFLFVFTLDFLLGKSPLSLYLVRLFSVVTVSSFLILSCFYHPQIFRIFYTTLCAAYGPIIINTSEQGAPKVWLTTLVLPLCVYLFTGSAWHFLIQIFIQIYYANTIYRTLLEKTLEFSNATDLTRSLTHAMNTAIFLLTVFVVLNHYLMRSAYTRLLATEKKKDEFENQKTFLLGFSHELRNLINSLSGHVKLASLENLTERAKELLLNAEVCSELLHHLVNNILDTGKVEIGELEINPMPTRTYDAIERIWGISSELIRRKALRGSLKIKKNIPKTLMIDHYRLTQIFLNLVGNAVKFTEQGSIDITVSWNDHSEEVTDKSFQPYPFNETDEHDEGLFEKEQVFSSLDESLQVLSLLSRKVDKDSLIQPINRSQKGVLKVVISDTGCGMSKEETVKLFQKFTQVSSDASKRKLGTGLGLFITKQLCQRMSGDIKVFSKKDKGSSFIFCISAEVGPDENEHLKNMEATHKFLSSQKLKVMIVDDAPFSHTVLKRFFDKLGIEVVDIAVNGLEAYHKYLQLLESGNRPDIVTMDLDMPIMDGKEAARKIRQLEQDRNLQPCFLPIISANCTESEITECINKNGRIKADVFLKKPASMEELIRILGRHFIR